jgi:hypothetical protein
MTETEIQKLQREIAERQSRLAQLVLGDQSKSVGVGGYSPNDDPDWRLGHGDNACEQDEGA